MKLQQAHEEAAELQAQLKAKRSDRLREVRAQTTAKS